MASILCERISSAISNAREPYPIPHNEECGRGLQDDISDLPAVSFPEWLRLNHRSPMEDPDASLGSDASPSLALITACIKGQFEVAKGLLESCASMELDWREPSPFHWLIMFDDTKASRLASMLARIRFKVEPLDVQKVLPINFNSKKLVSFQEHSLELAGTALHWAVRTGKIALVRSLVKHGADMNSRTREEYVVSNGIAAEQSPAYSPLDLAVAYHLPEITQYLLDAGADAEGGDSREKHFALNLIAMPVQPFSRYAIHGTQYRNATRETIRILLERGHDIEAANFEGKTAFELALEHPSQDLYILEELLGAGAKVSFPTSKTDAALLIARTSGVRFFNDSKLRLVLNHIQIINALDSFGFNPLHYAAQGGSDTMTAVLLQHPGIDPDTTTKDGRTALTLAAECDAMDVITILLESKVSIEGKSGPTPLEVSVNAQKSGSAGLLLHAGAKRTFEDDIKRPRSTVLIGAIARAPGAEPLTCKLLDEHPRVHDCINFQDNNGWSALHHAAWYGDFSSVKALIKHGADLTLRGSDETAGRVTALELAQDLFIRVCHDREAALHANHELFKKGGMAGMDYFIHGLQDVVKTLLISEAAKCYK